MDAIWTATVVTLFPELFPGPLTSSIPGRALRDRRWDIRTIQIRDYATDSHRTVDDSPYGGGVGMLLKPDVVHRALHAAIQSYARPPAIVFVSPRGEPLQQRHLQTWSQSDGLVILCGRYEGVDERVIELWKDQYHLEEVSLGDYVLSGGELAAYVMLDGCVRLLPNVLKKRDAAEIESFSQGLLEFSQYTRPAEWEGRCVPEVLVSGHHGDVAQWRKHNAEQITKTRRPDLWNAKILAR
jgi:tRNA (guanine37-N1)-methyltransferase